MANRLAAAGSSYLRQHADNPVDWWEWGPDPFAEAQRRGVPVLLSVGYASCHWCHVMAHESFADAATAAVVNRDFVAIKVDREERPDIDAIYMTATQALTGSGGWPMTCFLNPDGEPFYAGTYFPPSPHGGMPSFRQVLAAVVDAWRRDPGQVREAAARIAEHLQAVAAPLPAGSAPVDLDAAQEALLAEVDAVNGGFGGAPKFPAPLVMEFLLRHHERTGDRAALDAVTLTLEQMARGGIYDQLDGGFSRYSVDGSWHVPHFEKMLTDNALLLRLYAHHARLTGSELSHRIARETGEFLLRELRADEGGFIASLDADAAGVEGLTYRWPLGELVAVVHAVAGDDDAAVADVLASLGVDPARPDPEGEVLRLRRDPADPVLAAAVRAALLRMRARRPQPGRDEIVTLAGNGLAITALAEAGALLGSVDSGSVDSGSVDSGSVDSGSVESGAVESAASGWVAAASEVADILAERCRDAGGWRRSLFRGRPGTALAGLIDYASIASGLAALYQATGDVRRLRQATETLVDMVGRFRYDDGTWFDVPAGALIVRPRDPTDGAVPSGLSAAADALLTVSALTGDGELRARAEEIVASVAALAQRFPRSAGWHLAVAEALAAGPVQVAVAGPADPGRDALVRAARAAMPGGAVIDVGTGDEPGRPLLADRRGEGGAAAGYVCRGFVCDRPATGATELEERLRAYR